MNKSLDKLTILNTRPLPNSFRTRDFIIEHGGINIELPCLQIDPLASRWQQLLPHHCDYVLFTSPNAVYHSIEHIKKHWQHLPTIGAIGQATAKRLEDAQLHVGFISRQQHSEDFLQNEALMTVNQQTIVIIKGEGGRRLLHDTLIKRGARLIECDVYRRVAPKQLATNIKKILKNHDIDIILGTSVEAMENLFLQLDEEQLEKVKKATWLLKSERIADAVLSRQVERIEIAPMGNINKALINLGHQLTG